VQRTQAREKRFLLHLLLLEMQSYYERKEENHGSGDFKFRGRPHDRVRKLAAVNHFLLELSPWGAMLLAG